MKDKYYTPTLDEFHVGFEFESNYVLFEELSMKNDWTKIILSDRHNWFYDAYVNDAVPTEFRVKYLDKDDIEELGFNTEDNGECYNKSIGWMIIGIYPWEDVNGKPNEYKISVDTETVFHGVIKNKSELKRLLKQLNILDDTTDTKL